MAATKIIISFLALTVAYGAVVPIGRQGYRKFHYDIEDPSTGDYKTRSEVRYNGEVAGQYTVLEPNGRLRVVDYTADDVNGFNVAISWDPVVTIRPPELPKDIKNYATESGKFNVVGDLESLLANSRDVGATVKEYSHDFKDYGAKSEVVDVVADLKSLLANPTGSPGDYGSALREYSANPSKYVTSAFFKS